MTEHIIWLNPHAAPNVDLNAWLVANGVDPQSVACTEVTIRGDELTYTEFVREGNPPHTTLDPRGGGMIKRHRTVPLLTPYPTGLHTNNIEEADQ